MTRPFGHNPDFGRQNGLSTGVLRSPLRAFQEPHSTAISVSATGCPDGIPDQRLAGVPLVVPARLQAKGLGASKRMEGTFGKCSVIRGGLAQACKVLHRRQAIDLRAETLSSGCSTGGANPTISGCTDLGWGHETAPSQGIARGTA